QDVADRRMQTLERRIEQAAEARASGAMAPSEHAIRQQTMEGIQNAGSDLARFRENVAPEASALRGEELPPFDGMLHEFEIAAPQPITDVHVVFLLRLRRPDGEFVDFNYAHELGDVDREPRKVR